MALQSNDTKANGFNSAVRDAWLSRNHMPLFTSRSPIFKRLEQQGNIQPSGYGTIMREPLMVPVLTGPQLEGVSNSFSDVEAQPMTGYTTAEYPLSMYRIIVAWDDYDDVRAGGEVEMVQWREAHFKNALLRSYEKVKQDFWAAPENALSAGDRTQIASIRTFINGGTTTATDGGAQPPAQAEQSKTPVVGATGTTAVTLVGGIERSAAGAAYWCPCLLGTAGSTVALTTQILNDIYEAAYQEGEEPDLIIAPPGVMSKLQLLMTSGGTSGGQFYTGSKRGQLGFSSLGFRNADIVVDRRCPTAGFDSGGSTACYNHLYCLNTKHLKIRMKSRKPSFEDIPTNKAIQQHKGLWYLALTSDHLGNVHSMHKALTP